MLACVSCYFWFTQTDWVSSGLLNAITRQNLRWKSLLMLTCFKQIIDSKILFKQFFFSRFSITSRLNQEEGNVSALFFDWEIKSFGLQILSFSFSGWKVSLSIRLDTDNNVECLRFGFFFSLSLWRSTFLSFPVGSITLFTGPTNFFFHQNFHYKWIP